MPGVEGGAASDGEIGIEGVAGPAGLRGRAAGLVSRSVAAAIDVVVVAVTLVLAAVSLAAARYLVLGPPPALPDPPRAVTAAVADLVAIAYLAWAGASTGRTAGKQVMGLRLVGRSGRRLGPGRAVLRAALSVHFPLGLLWAAFSRRDASVQDLVVHSAVVYDWPHRGGSSGEPVIRPGRPYRPR